MNLDKQILDQLVKLNKQMGELLCFQKLAAMKYAERHGGSVGQPPADDVGREVRVLDLPDRKAAAV